MPDPNDTAPQYVMADLELMSRLMDLSKRQRVMNRCIADGRLRTAHWIREASADEYRLACKLADSYTRKETT